MRGYIDIGNERFILDDDTKKHLTDTADKLHEQQEQAIMIAAAEQYANKRFFHFQDFYDKHNL